MWYDFGVSVFILFVSVLAACRVELLMSHASGLEDVRQKKDQAAK